MFFFCRLNRFFCRLNLFFCRPNHFFLALYKGFFGFFPDIPFPTLRRASLDGVSFIEALYDAITSLISLFPPGGLMPL